MLGMKKNVHPTPDLRKRAVSAYIQGMSIDKITQAYSIGRSTLYRWISKHRKNTKTGLNRSKNPGSGRPRKLSEVKSKEFSKIIRQGALKFGFETDLWTCDRVVQVFRKNFGVVVSRQTINRRLREAGLTYQKPEHRYAQASKKERKIWKKEELPLILACVRKYKGILYFHDEANISLNVVTGKTWAPEGKTPTITTTGERGGFAALSAINKQGGFVFKLLEKRIVSKDVIQFFSQILAHHPRRHIVIVMDRAPPHTSGLMNDFVKSQRRLHVFYLPRYSPDWNPDEKVWNHLKHQELKGHQARTKDELKGITRRKLLSMQKNKKTIRGIFLRCHVSSLLD